MLRNCYVTLVDRVVAAADINCDEKSVPVAKNLLKWRKCYLFCIRRLMSIFKFSSVSLVSWSI